jgi:Flp pilus assembly protein TadD
MQSRALAVLLLVVPSAVAQHDAGDMFGRDPGNMVQRVRVHLELARGTCGATTRVLLSSHGGPFIEGTQSNDCDFEFVNVPEGDYSVQVSGTDLTTADVNSDIHISASGSADFEIQMKRTTMPQNSGLPANTFVSASDLAIPGRARKEFEKATELVRRQELQEAIKRLNKAIHFYPQYAVAYNNLAVIYGQLGDRVHEKEGLQKAISLNPNFALGYVNLGRMEMKANNYLAAEPFLTKAAELNPGDVNALVLLSYSEFMDKSFDAAIANSRKAHALQQPHAFVHRVAARAFEQEKRGADAIAELEAFLKEEPSGPRAAAARQEIDVVKTALPN